MQLLRKVSVAIAGICLFLYAAAASADFTQPVVISDANCSASSRPDIAEAPDGTLHVFWSCRISCTSCGDYQGNIQHSLSADGGATWSAPQQITASTGSFREYTSPRAAIGADGVMHLAYYYINYYGYSTVYYARSSDNGQTWSSRAMQSGCFAWYPEVTLDSGGNVFMAWDMWLCRTTMDTVYAARSLDNGLTWSSPVPAASGQPLSFMKPWVNGLLADAAGNVHLLPADRGSTVAGAHVLSVDKGATWAASLSLPEGFGIRGLARSGDLLLAPAEYNGSSVLLSSPDSGATWQNSSMIAGYLPASGMELATSSAGYFARLDSDVFHSSDEGATWEKIGSLTGGPYWKMLATGNGRLVAAGMNMNQVGIVKYEFPTLSGTLTLLDSLMNTGQVDVNVAGSLSAKLAGAVQAATAGAADGKLQAFINEINAQTGKKITAEAAADLIKAAMYIMQHN